MTLRKKSKLIRLINFSKVLGLNIKEIKEKELFIKNGLLIQSNKIKQNTVFLTINAKDCIISPGFIDPQVNGLDKCSFWNFSHLPSFTNIDKLRLKLAHKGVVAFCPTIITNKKEKIIQSINHLNKYIKGSSADAGAKILGIHLEGIFITKHGVHNSKYTENELTVKKLEPFIKDNVIMITLAPELDKTGIAIKFLQKNNILVSIGHSNATYSEGLRAIKKYNLKTVTHMFNSLRGIEGFSHRDKNNKSINILKSKLENKKLIDPEHDGIILALLNHKNVLCMVIADGVHVNKETVGLLRKYKDRGHFSLCSDLVSSDFFKAAKKQDILGGGQSTIDSCVANLIKWNVSNIEDSLICASKPISNQLKRAKELGFGEISFGKEANIVLWDTSKNAVKGTIIGENVFLNY